MRLSCVEIRRKKGEERLCQYVVCVICLSPHTTNFYPFRPSNFVICKAAHFPCAVGELETRKKPEFCQFGHTVYAMNTILSL